MGAVPNFLHGMPSLFPESLDFDSGYHGILHDRDEEDVEEPVVHFGLKGVPIEMAETHVAKDIMVGEDLLSFEADGETAQAGFTHPVLDEIEHDSVGPGR